MKRRGFLQVLAGLVGAAATSPLSQAPVAPSGESFVAPLTGEGVAGDALLTGNEEALMVWRNSLYAETQREGFGMSVRELFKADLAQELQNELDRRVLDALTGKKSSM